MYRTRLCEHPELFKRPEGIVETFLRCLFNSASNFHIFVVKTIRNVMSTVYVIKNTKVS